MSPKSSYRERLNKGLSERPERYTYTVGEVARLLGISRGSAYQAVGRGEIRSVRVGRRVLIPRRAIESLLDPPHDTSQEQISESSAS